MLKGGMSAAVPGSSSIDRKVGEGGAQRLPPRGGHIAPASPPLSLTARSSSVVTLLQSPRAAVCDAYQVDRRPHLLVRHHGR